MRQITVKQKIIFLACALLLLLFSLTASAENEGQTISAGNTITVAVRNDESVLYAGITDPQFSGAGASQYWGDIVSVSAGQLFVAGLKKDGSTIITRYVAPDTSYFANEADKTDVWDGKELEEVNSWTDIQMIYAGTNHVLGLHKDGTVVAAGSDRFGQCRTEEWTDIIEISAGSSHSVGLRKDGTVVAVGSNEKGQCNVSRWKNIVAVSAGGNQTIGLTENGKLVYAGPVWKEGAIASQLIGWKNIVAISAGDFHVVGLREDGTVVSTTPIPTPFMRKGQDQVESWRDIVAVSAGTDHTIGLKSDGTLVAAGKNTACNISSWKGIRLPN